MLNSLGTKQKVFWISKYVLNSQAYPETQYKSPEISFKCDGGILHSESWNLKTRGIVSVSEILNFCEFSTNCRVSEVFLVPTNGFIIPTTEEKALR